MANAWGLSWGSAWANSWAISAVVTPPADQGSGGKLNLGNRTVSHSFTREKFRALMEALRAKDEAKERGKRFKRKKDRIEAASATQAIALVLEQAREAADSSRDVLEIKEATRLLEGAARAKALGDFLAQLEAARLAFIAAIDEQASLHAEIEDEEDVIAMLLAA